MADFFDFSQPAIDLNLKPSMADLNIEHCCAGRLYDDIKDAKPAMAAPSSARAVESASSSVTPFFGVLSDMAPGQPLAFDSNLRKLDFGPTAASGSKFEAPPIGNNNLQFDHKVSGALIIGLQFKI